MKTTIPQAVSERPVQASGIQDWTNREALPVLRQTRRMLNAEPFEAMSLSTTGTGTFTQIWSSDPLPTDSAVYVEARIIGRSVADRCVYLLRGVFSNVAGVVAQQGATFVEYSEESAAACDAQMLVSGQAVVVNVRDAGAAAFHWRAVVRWLASEEVPA